MAKIESVSFLIPPGWEEGGLLDTPGEKGIDKTFGFNEYRQAVRFATAVADLADKRQHHPDILLRYRKVKIVSSTHDAGGITEKDLELAAEIDQLYNSLND